MKKLMIILVVTTIILSANSCYGITISTDGSYRNPYQRMWFDGVWRKDCKYNTEQQMCESTSMNLQSMKKYNEFKSDKYYCIGGYLYHLYGFSNIPSRIRTSEFSSDFQTCQKQNNVWFDTMEDFKRWYNQGNR